MPTLDTTTPPATPALRQWRERAPRPTPMSSAELRGLGRDVWRRSVMSARTTNAAYLAEVAEVLDDLISGKIEMPTAKMRLYFKLKELGYDPEVGFPEDMGKVPPAQRGSLRDLSSQKRLKLVLETNRQIASGYGRMVDGNRDYALYTWPAWELVRIYDRDVPRGSPDSHSIGWAYRWRDAGGKFYEGGRMIARKDDPVWQALGDGSGGYEDTLGNPYPPFAFRSGFGWKAVEREECLRLGIITGEEMPGRTEAPLEDTGGDAVRKIYQSWPEDIRQQFRAELAEQMETTRDWLRKEMEAHKSRQIAESRPLQNAGYDPSQPRGCGGRWGSLMAPDKGGEFGDGGRMEQEQDWLSLGLDSAENIPAQTPQPKLVTREEALEKLSEPYVKTDPLGFEIVFGTRLREHLEAHEDEMSIRFLPHMEIAVTDPAEIWFRNTKDGPRIFHLAVFARPDGSRSFAVVSHQIGEMKGNIVTATPKTHAGLNAMRHGKLLYRK